tara:strand:- start:13113 stop:14240 length:1128 start_codon:yes stop_codon:yes gene_type:complete
MEVKGICEKRFLKVKEVFEKLHNEGREVGSSFAIYQDGKPLVSLYAGFSDKDKKIFWAEDSLSTVWSTTKGVTAICVALAVEEGLLDYEEKVTTYWPEFGNNGKENITVGMLLSHQAGICGGQTKNITDYYSQEIMASKLANMVPLWEPGTECGYHSLTYGWLASELMIRTTGMNIGSYFRKKIGDPHDIDFYIGLPESEEHRVATMYPFKEEKRSKDTISKLSKALQAIAFAPNVGKAQKTKEWRKAEISSANGQGHASGLAKLYSLLVPKDESIGILKRSTVQRMTKEQIISRDLVLGVVMRWGAGFVTNLHKIIYGPVKQSFGHSGFGGSCAFADPENRIAMSYVMNKLEPNLAGDSRSVALINTSYECMDI